MASLPSRERGLKFPTKWDNIIDNPVAPLAGAWIEIEEAGRYDRGAWQVAPLAGAWIEIDVTDTPYLAKEVAPLAGAWIEIPKWTKTPCDLFRRSPRVSADWNSFLLHRCNFRCVAPLAGARIEIGSLLSWSRLPSCRSPRGSADWNRLVGSNRHYPYRSLPSRERRLKSKRQSYIMYYVIT